MPEIRSLKLPKLYASSAQFQEGIRYKDMAEKLLAQCSIASLDKFDDHISHVCGDAV